MIMFYMAKHRRKPSSYKNPPKKGCKHRYDPGTGQCVNCGEPKAKPKGKDPKVKVRMKARTKKRMPPPRRGH